MSFSSTGLPTTHLTSTNMVAGASSSETLRPAPSPPEPSLDRGPVEAKPKEPMPGLLALIREDIRRNLGWHRPGARAMVAYRLASAAQRIKNPILGKICRRIGLSLLRKVRNRYGIELFATMTIGRRFLIGHQGAIVLHEYAVIGDDCLIRQGVTMGLAGKDVWWSTPENAPRIGDRVDIGAGAVILGNVKIGDDARIYPNAVVVTDVPAMATVMTPVGRVMPHKPKDAVASN